MAQWSNRALTVMCAPWDWDILRWSLPSWFPVARRGKLFIAYNASGAGTNWTALQDIPRVPQPADLSRRLEELFDLATDAGIVACQAVPHDLTDEFACRNLLLDTANSKINIVPDADEYLLDVDGMLAGIEKVKRRNFMAAGFPVWQHVVGFDGSRVRCFVMEKTARSPVVVERQVVWCAARVLFGHTVNIDATVWHWRIPRSAAHLKFRTYTDTDASDTFESWIASALEGAKIPERFVSDARALREQGATIGPWIDVPSSLIPPCATKGV